MLSATVVAGRASRRIEPLGQGGGARPAATNPVAHFLGAIGRGAWWPALAAAGVDGFGPMEAAGVDGLRAAGVPAAEAGEIATMWSLVTEALPA